MDTKFQKRGYTIGGKNPFQKTLTTMGKYIYIYIVSKRKTSINHQQTKGPLKNFSTKKFFNFIKNFKTNKRKAISISKNKKHIKIS